MRIFLSWSGYRSRAVAVELRDWLPKVIQALKPWMSAEDIEKGTQWGTALPSQLDENLFGVVCLTSDNQSSPWINFEAGAISKHVGKSRVWTFLVGIGNNDVRGPLGLFQHTEFEKNDVWRLIEDINRVLEGEPRLSDGSLKEAFEDQWPKLEVAINRILTEVPAATVEQRKPEDYLDEILTLVRGLSSAAGTSQDLAASGRSIVEVLALDNGIRDRMDAITNQLNIVSVGLKDTALSKNLDHINSHSAQLRSIHAETVDLLNYIETYRTSLIWLRTYDVHKASIDQIRNKIKDLETVITSQVAKIIVPTF